jgi:hypothetical protein
MRRQGNVFTIVCALLLCGALADAAAPASADVPDALLLPGGRAVAPASAPPAVKAMIEAGNRIRNRPYKWGGGHRRWNDRGYDCSGSVSYVIHAAGLLDWGGGGAGSWVRIYANEGHVFAVIAGLRWDTSYITDGDRSGPGWSEEMRSTGDFRVRHPLGLLQATPLG